MKENIVLKIDNGVILIDIELVSKCWSCSGGFNEPDIEDYDDTNLCGPCKGTGYVITDAGHAILDLIEISNCDGGKKQRDKHNSW